MGGKPKKTDLTEGPIFKPMLAFLLPMIGSSLFQQLYNTVDFIFIGNLLDTAAAAGVGASSTLISCEIGMFSGIAVGTSVVIAQAVGARDRIRAEKALHTSLLFGLTAGTLLMLACLFLARPILLLLNTPRECMEDAVVYMRIYSLSLPFMVFYNMGSGTQRAYGDSRTPFRILAVCGVFNVAADAFFLLVIPLGVAGVAIATFLSQVLSAILSAASLHRQESPVRFSWKKLRLDRRILSDVLRVGLPSGIQTVLITFSNIIIQFYINAYGETAVAAFATYYKVENFIYFPIVGFGQAATTFAGQNTGAGKYRRVEKGTLIAAVTGAVLTFLLASVILIFRETVFGWFMKNEEVVADALLIAGISFPFYWIYPLLEIYGGALRGMGYSMESMVTIIASMCGLRIALLAIASAKFHSISALAAVYPVTWATAAVLFMVQFAVIIRRKKNVGKNMEMRLSRERLGLRSEE